MRAAFVFTAVFSFVGDCWNFGPAVCGTNSFQAMTMMWSEQDRKLRRVSCFIFWCRLGNSTWSAPLHLSIADRLGKVGFERRNTEGCHSQDERALLPIVEIEHRVAGRVEHQIARSGLVNRLQSVIEVVTGV